jgi:hypothetical protein
MTRIVVIGRSADSTIAHAIPDGWSATFLDGFDESSDFREIHRAQFALFCMSATVGFDITFIKYWKALEELHMPRAVVVTDLDNPEADFDESCALIARVLDEGILPVALVLHEEDGSPAALIDLFSLQVSQGESLTDAEPEVVDLVMDAREELLQEIATSIANESISNQLMQGITPSSSVLHSALINAVATAVFIPVLTSAESGILGRREMHALLSEVLTDPGFEAEQPTDEGNMEGFLNRYLPQRLLEGNVDGEITLSINFPDEYATEVDREISRAQVTARISTDRQGVSLREFEISRLTAMTFLTLIQNACDYNAVVKIIAS